MDEREQDTQMGIGKNDMETTKQSPASKGWVFFLILTVSFAVLGVGYWLYQRSIARAVYSTTVSFMEQIADHDYLNINNQMSCKWEYLDSILERIRSSRNAGMQEVMYDLGVGARSTAFEKLYVITDHDKVFSSSYLETALSDMPWSEVFEQADGNFVTRYSEDSREQWGEYLLYGIRLPEPVTCGDDEIFGIIGLVPITEIASQMRLESFNGQGAAIVITPAGEVITASQQYKSNSVTQNYLSSLENVQFLKGGSVEACRKAIEQREALFTQYSQNGESFYALFQPMGYQDGNGWYLVVRVSTEVTETQVRVLIARSLSFFFVLGAIILGVTYFVYRSLNLARVAQASERAKSSFLANMSHEIRTPLNGIVGLLYLMRQNLDDRRKVEGYLKKAEVSAEFLKSVITDVLDMSKIESGQLEIYRDKMDLSGLVKDIEVLIGIQTEERGLRFLVDSGGLICPSVTGDTLRIKQVLTNLLGNSLKFTPKGGEVSLKVDQRLKDGVAETTFIVADTGCGMSPEFLEHIWTPFEQEKRAVSQNGTGLGTTLSKTLVEKMGGSIAVKSVQGKGTQFTVRLPLQVAELSAAQADDKAAVAEEKEKAVWELKGKRILVAEDNEINRMIIVSILEEQGCMLTEAGDGREALKAFEESPAGFFDLILMDIRMPVMDGYEAVRKIRSLGRPDSSMIPIFAMTANAFREDTDEALESGMDDVITKPLEIALLLKKISHIQRKGEV